MISHIYPVDYNSSPSCFAVARLSGLFQEHVGSCLTRKNSNAGLQFQFKNYSFDLENFTSKSMVVNASNKTEMSNVK